MPLQCLVTVGNSTKDYSRYVVWNGLKIAERINMPTTVLLAVQPSDALFECPPQRAYVQIWSNKYQRSLFTGFVSSEPKSAFRGMRNAGAGQGGQVFEYSITVTSDEHLLNI